MALKDDLAIANKRADEAEERISSLVEEIDIYKEEAEESLRKLEEHRLSREDLFQERVEAEVESRLLAAQELIDKAEEEESKKLPRFKCCFGGHKEIILADVTIGSEFVLTDEHRDNASFMKSFKRALQNKTICHY